MSQLTTTELKRTVFVSVLSIKCVVFFQLAATWWFSPTPGRASGVQWVAGWMNTGVVGAAWLLAALACLVAIVSAMRVKCRGINVEIYCAVVATVVPLLIASWFMGAWVVWTFNADQTPEALDNGSPNGYVTAFSYAAYACTPAFALLLYAGVVEALQAAWRDRVDARRKRGE